MAILQVENIHKSFGSSKVLKGISFSIEKGEVLAIIGSSGSGKTTLLRCLNFLEHPDEGKITVDGKLLIDAAVDKKIREKEIRLKRLHFGLVFQSFNLFPQYNVLKNVTLAPTLLASEMVDSFDKDAAKPMSDERRAALIAAKSSRSVAAKRHIMKPVIESEARQTLESVGLTEKINYYPHQLSGGQQQRVAIARALVLNPDILCFDEPTSALDPELTGEVLKAIQNLKPLGKTMIVVTHEMQFARDVADSVIFMADGAIVEQGTPEEVFGNPKEEKTKTFLAKYKENSAALGGGSAS